MECFIPLKRAATPRLRLFMLPHAGGGPSVFAEWSSSLPDIEYFAAQLPGRGARFQEPPLRRIEPLLEELTASVTPLLNRPFLLFGHSFGAMVAFDLAHQVRSRTGLEPVALVASGCAAPSCGRRGGPLRHLASDAELTTDLRRMGGTPPDVLGNADLMELYLPALRADFEILETRTAPERKPLTCPVIAVAGAHDDTVSDRELNAWRSVSSGPFEAQRFAGGHFYPPAAAAELIAFIVSRGSKLTAPAKGS